MLSNYIVRTKDLYSFYYRPEDGILCRIYQNGKWGREQQVFSGARDNFTVSLDSAGVIYLFLQDREGNVVLCSGTDGEFKKQPVLKNYSNKIYTLQLNPIITPKGICLIYSLPEENTIALQHSQENGRWSKPERLDKFMSLSDCMFVLQQISGEHHILFYQTRGTDINLGYREVTPSAQGQYNIFHSSNYPVADASFLTTENAIHVLYVIKGMFSSQLVYRKKEDGPFTAPVVLCEGQRLDNILLYRVGRQIYASFINLDQLYVCVSDGGNFSRPERYSKKFCLNPVKAVYVGAPSDEYCLRQVYVDRNNPYDIQLIPDLCEDFYPIPTPEKIKTNEDEFIKLQDQVEALSVRNRDLEQQVTYLTDLLRKSD